MVERAVSTFGKIGVLINNGALFASAWNQRGPSEKLTVDEWDRMFAVNARGTWLCCKHVVQHMRERSGGSIINISPGTARKGSAGFLHYVTSKAAIAGSTDGPGPFGAKAIGESSNILTAAAIANAVFDACGVCETELPLTAEKVFAGLAHQQRGRSCA